MVRPTLFQLGPNDHVLLVRLHHIAFDAFSDKNFFGELDALYSGFTERSRGDARRASIQYADYAVWQREHLSGPHLARLVEYWRNELSGAPPLLLLPIDGTRVFTATPRRPAPRDQPAGRDSSSGRRVRPFGRRDSVHDPSRCIRRPALPGLRSGRGGHRQSDREPRPARARSPHRLLHQHARRCESGSTGIRHSARSSAELARRRCRRTPIRISRSSESSKSSRWNVTQATTRSSRSTSERRQRSVNRSSCAA